MNEVQLIEGARRIIPHIRLLIEHAKRGDEKATLEYRTTHVTPSYESAFKGCQRLVDTVNPEIDNPNTLPALAMHAINYAPYVFMGDDFEGVAELRELAIPTALSFLERMKNVVAAYQPAAQS